MYVNWQYLSPYDNAKYSLLFIFEIRRLIVQCINVLINYLVIFAKLTYNFHTNLFLHKFKMHVYIFFSVIHFIKQYKKSKNLLRYVVKLKKKSLTVQRILKQKV